MNVTFLDLEMNKSGTIIEIGAVAANLKTGETHSRFSSLARLENEELHAEIIALTGITPEDLNDTRPLKEVVASFWNWLETNQTGCRLWCWGNDADILIEQSGDLQIPDKLSTFDVKQLAQFFKSAAGSKAKGGLQLAMAEFGLTFMGRPHRALNDAANTATLTCYLHKCVRDFFQVKALFKCGSSS